MTPPRTFDSERKLRESLVVQVAMWADAEQFGHRMDDMAYEDECERLVNNIYDEIWDALRERPLR